MLQKIANFLSILLTGLQRNFTKELFIGIGLILSTIVLITGNVITNGLKTIYEESLFSNMPVNELKIEGTVKTFVEGSILDIEKIKRKRKVNNISTRFAEDIKTYKSVDKIYPITKALFPISIYVIAKPPIKNNETILLAEPPVIGIPESIALKYIKKYTSKEAIRDYKKNFPNGFKRHGRVVPVLIPRYIEDIGKNIMQTNTLPNIDLSALHKFFELDILMNKSTILRKKKRSKVITLKGKIVGFVDIDLTAGIAIPKAELDIAKNLILPKSEREGYEALIIRLKKDADIKAFTNKIKSLLAKENIKISKSSILSKIAEYIKSFINYFELTIYFIGAGILFITLVAIFYGFSYIFLQRQNETKLYRFFGASKVELILLIVLESLIIGLFYSGMGYAFSYLITSSYITSDANNIMSLFPKAIRTYIFRNELKEIFKFFNDENKIFITIIITFSTISALSVGLVGIFSRKEE